ncbi:hypothetical protein L207DRAFT_593423 [Hyaloscypha variabilis F]|uniref:Uncharacterized protein n=1 Tax=Hyaloscypha variabilis (strain UAMH 11265 / GT02V1 / F) TaxID=1149755 RepID=A0A2J6QSY7_HYAVF|nr:hypothetical protein L207DRAFT_593423 [Hyaloscypha variabilis F]
MSRRSTREAGRPKGTLNTDLPPPTVPGELKMGCLEHLHVLANIQISTYAVFEYDPQEYYELDLQIFLSNLVTATNYSNYDPTVYVMSYASFYSGSPGFYTKVKGNLDIQIAQGLGD